jgi:hypothetical protein
MFHQSGVALNHDSIPVTSNAAVANLNIPSRNSPAIERWSQFLTQPAKVDSPMQRMIHHENAETVFG